MTARQAFAPAKINLTLHVTGQRADGYHLLDSLVVFADVGDHLSYHTAHALSMDITGPFAKGVPADQRNLVWRAAELAGWTGHITLEKHLPHGAGIGGGSADAAALLRGLAGDDVTRGIGLEAALSLGADVPVCLHAGAQRMQGIGEVLTRCLKVPALQLVLVNPGLHLPTPSVFAALTTRDNAPMSDLPATANRAAFVSWLAEQRNDLQGAAINVQPQIAQVLEALSDAELARMSGSGATCFGIYRDEKTAKTAAERIETARPDWWVRPAQTAGISPA
jgi:4-diphosphocytidyl-2-C-methyl-D-erythritol kinase